MNNKYKEFETFNLPAIEKHILDNYLHTKAQNKKTLHSASQIAVADKPINLTPSKIPILMYHAIDYDNNDLYVSKFDFENQIIYLVKNNYNFITFEDLANNNIPPKEAIITYQRWIMGDVVKLKKQEIFR